jgi:tRNA(fMet)-specific endonuclease VapC
LKVLDTDVCVEILRGNRDVIGRRRNTGVRVVTTWVTAGELFYGAAKSREPARNRELVERFLETLVVVGLDTYSVQFFGALKAQLELEGRRLADADLWIAGIARAHRAIVVTGNVKHFSRIPGVEIENWLR